MNEINSYHSYKKMVSKNEYKSLSDTLRDRLINSVMSKKARLSKDKDAIEIGEETHMLCSYTRASSQSPTPPAQVVFLARELLDTAEKQRSFPTSPRIISASVRLMIATSLLLPAVSALTMVRALLLGPLRSSN